MSEQTGIHHLDIGDQVTPPRFTLGPGIHPSQLYAALPIQPGSRCIRLLELDPSPSLLATTIYPSFDQPLIGRLRVVKLNDSLQFIALSYVWGTPETKTPNQSIYCTDLGVSLDITKNCHAALLQLLRRASSSAGRVTVPLLWVDSICINQDDEEEKVGQISLMQDIYNNAREVAVWLAEGNDKSDCAMEYLHKVARTGRRFPLDVVTARTQSERKNALSSFRGKLLHDWISRLIFRKPSQKHIQLDEILNREWIHRSWTFQELVLANRPVIMCGTKVLAWEDLVSAVGVMQQHRMRRWRPESVAYPVSLPVLMHWTSVVDLWFSVPRSFPEDSPDQEGEPDAEKQMSTSNTEKPSVRERIFSHWGKRGELYLPLRFLHYATSAIMVLGASFAWGLAVFETGFAASRDKKVGINWALIVIFWLASFGLAYRATRGLVEWWHYICHGKEHAWLRLAESTEHTFPAAGALDGIRAALRERASSRPHDKVFSLLGILKAYGATAPAPDYRLPLDETYQTFLSKLFAWTPAALVMLLDTGGDPPGGQASWVPNWGEPPPSAWLTAGCRLSAGPSAATRSQKLDILMLLDGKLKIRGERIGRVTALTPKMSLVSTEGLEGSALQSAFSTNTRTLWRWHHLATSRVRISVADDSIEGYQFAVLEGLVRKRIPSWVAAGDGEAARLELWQAPLDFADRKEDFVSFSNLGRILSSQKPQDGGGDDGDAAAAANKPRLEALEEELSKEDSKDARNYMAKTVNRLVSDKRNLFLAEQPSASWLGSGPLSMQLGDAVFVIPGVPTPMALRRVAGESNENVYRVVGAVFVHGKMEADAFHRPAYEHVFLV